MERCRRCSARWQPGKLVYLWLAIFCTFAMLGFVLDRLSSGRGSATFLVVSVIAYGLFAVGSATVAMPARPLGLVAMLVVHHDSRPPQVDNPGIRTPGVLSL